MPGTDTVGVVFGFCRGAFLEPAPSLIPTAKQLLGLTGAVPLRRTSTGLVSRLRLSIYSMVASSEWRQDQNELAQPGSLDAWRAGLTVALSRATSHVRGTESFVDLPRIMDRDYLTAIVNGFVLPSRRSRFLAFLASNKRYRDFLHGLLHDPRNFDPEVIVRLRSGERSSDFVFSQLRRLGAGQEGYLVGDCGELHDGHLAGLKEILDVCVGSMDDALVYAPQASVAYYEGHEGFAYILRARRASGC